MIGICAQKAKGPEEDCLEDGKLDLVDLDIATHEAKPKRGLTRGTRAAVLAARRMGK